MLCLRPFIKYRSQEEQLTFQEKTKAIEETIFNKEFNKFVRTTAKDDTPYLYLTGGSSKIGVMLNYFISNGMTYEIVPNLFYDDESINLRIPLIDENIKRKDVQYLYSKYSNTYSIYNIPFTCVGGAFTSLPKKIYNSSGFYLPKNREIISYAIANTLRTILNSSSDYEVYKKLFLKSYDYSSHAPLFSRIILKTCCYYIQTIFLFAISM